MVVTRFSIRSVVTAAVLSLWLAMLPGLCLAAAPSAALDLVLVIDDSAALDAVDPARRLPALCAAFLDRFGVDARVAVVAFDDLATARVPLTPLDAMGRDQVAAALATLQRTATRSNSAAGLERAIYALTRDSVAAAQRVILLLHATPIDVGNVSKDEAFRQWAIEVLTDKAAAAGVRVDSLSIGARADVAMGAALAERTGGSAAVADDAGQLGNLLAIFAQRLTSTTADKAVAEAPRQLTPPSATLPRPAAALNGAADWRNPASPDPVVALESLPAPAAGPVTALAVAGEGVGGVVHGLSRGWSNNATWRALGYSIVLLILTAASISYVWRRRVTAKSAIDVDHGGPRLIDIRGISGRRSYSLDHKMVRISRAPAADTANVVTVHIPRDVISRAHAFIDWRDGAYWVTDPGSNNGTYVNDERVAGSRALCHGDRVRFAAFEFEFEHPPARVDAPAGLPLDGDQTLVDDLAPVDNHPVAQDAQPTIVASRGAASGAHDAEHGATIVRRS